MKDFLSWLFDTSFLTDSHFWIALIIAFFSTRLMGEIGTVPPVLYYVIFGKWHEE